MRRLAVSFAASVLSAVYWWVVFTLLYADVMFAADRSPDARPIAASQAHVHSLIVVTAGLAIFTALAAIWDRATARWRT